MSEAAVAFAHYDAADERRRESLLGLGNGALFVRASAPEHGARLLLVRLTGRDAGSPAHPSAHASAHSSAHYAGTYRAGLYNVLESRLDTEPPQMVRNTFVPRLPDAMPLAVRPRGGAWCVVDAGDDDDAAHAAPARYRHALDLDEAVARRSFVVRDGARTTHIEETRLVSAAHAPLVLLRWIVTPLDWSGTLEVCDGIDGEVRNTNVARQAAYAGRHVVEADAGAVDDETLLLTARLSGAEVELALAARTRIDAPAGSNCVHRAGDAIVRLREVAVQAGRPLSIDKLVAIRTSRDAAAGDHASGALELLDTLARTGGADAAYAAHRRAWQACWHASRCLGGEPAFARQLDIRLFHLLQTFALFAAREDAGVPSRGWQEAYHGHAFWDEIFIVPLLATRQPDAARAPLRYRFDRLDAARRRAREAGGRGVLFPWRSADTGEEETPRYQRNLLDGHWLRDDTWLQRHIDAAIAWDVWACFRASGDLDFLHRHGAPLLVEIARFWAGAARFEQERQRFVIRKVVGPDEYHHVDPRGGEAGLDNNAYTNLMAVWTLGCARAALRALPGPQRAAVCAAYDVTDDETRHWERIERHMYVPFTASGAIAQFDGYERLLPLAASEAARHERAGRLDWTLEARGDSTDRYQIAKQPDVPMLFHLFGPEALCAMLNRLGYAFDADAARHTLHDYLERLSHESSLSRIVCAGALARFEPERSWRYFEAALRVDLDPQAGSGADEGLHLGAFAGILDVLQRHYAGLDFRPDALYVEPAWPRALPPVSFAVTYRGQRLRIDGSAAQCRLTAHAANRETMNVCGSQGPRRLSPGESLDVPTPGRRGTAIA